MDYHSDPGFKQKQCQFPRSLFHRQLSSSLKVTTILMSNFILMSIFEFYVDHTVHIQSYLASLVQDYVCGIQSCFSYKSCRSFIDAVL